MSRITKNIYGAEAIVLHRECLVLGVQKKNRWKEQAGKTIITIKTIGGSTDADKQADAGILREFGEEINLVPSVAPKFISPKMQYAETDGVLRKMRFKDTRILAKVASSIGSMLPHMQDSKISMHGTFYALKLEDSASIGPRDLPALCILPISHIRTWNFQKEYTRAEMDEFLTCQDRLAFPENSRFVFMVPKHFHALLTCV